MKEEQQSLLNSYQKEEENLFLAFGEFLSARYEATVQGEELQKKENLDNIENLAESINNSVTEYDGVENFKKAMFQHSMEKPHEKSDRSGTKLEHVTMAELVFDEKFPDVLQQTNHESLKQLATDLRDNKAEMIKDAYNGAKTYIEKKLKLNFTAKKLKSKI